MGAFLMVDVSVAPRLTRAPRPAPPSPRPRDATGAPPGAGPRRRGAAVAEHRAVLDAVGVDGAPAQAQPQRAREGRLDRAGVRARVRGGVATPGADGVARASADQGRARGRDQRRDARGHHAGDVVGARRGPPEALVARRAVPDHGVEGVDRAVPEQSRHARERTPHQRRDDGVGGVLRDRLQRRAGEAVGVEGGRVPAAEMGQALPSRREVPGAQRGRHRRALGRQRRAPEHRPRGRGGHEGVRERTSGGSPLEQQPAGHRPADEHRGVGDPGAAAVGPPAPLERAGQGAERRDGVTAARVAEHRVGEHPQREARGPREGHVRQPPGPVDHAERAPRRATPAPASRRGVALADLSARRCPSVRTRRASTCR